MRLIGFASSVFALVLTCVISGFGQVPAAQERRGTTVIETTRRIAAAGVTMARRSSATTRSVTNSCGRMCCACTSRLRR